MRTINRTIKLIIFLILGSIFQLYSQVLDPVKWSSSLNRINEKEAELVFTAKIDKKWHVYSQFIGEGGPIATKFDITKTKDFELVGPVSESPKPTEEYDKNFDMKLKFYSHFKFTTFFTVTRFLSHECYDRSINGGNRHEGKFCYIYY